MSEEKKQSGMQAVMVALGANVLVAISKFIGFSISGSAAMLNESIHSIVDCSNQILLMVGDKKSKKAASDLHAFGEGRAKYFFSTVVAMMLFFGGGALGIMEALEKIGEHGHSMENPVIVLSILLFGIAVEAYSLHIAFKEIKHLNTDKLPLWKFLRESRHSEILIIFAEDSCAVLGLLIAFAGTLLTMLTHNPFFDAFGGLLIGIMLLVAALLLAREFYSLIIGESVSDKDLVKIEKAFQRTEVEKLIDIKTTHLSPTDIIVLGKIDVTEQVDREKLINEIEKDIRGQFEGYKVFISIEVDEYQEDYDLSRK